MRATEVTRKFRAMPPLPTESVPGITRLPLSPIASNSHGESSDHLQDWLIEPFQPIALPQLNSKAAMLNRLDNKYIVGASVLRNAIPRLAEHFDILEIDGKRDFTYLTCYFDDREFTSYFEHHNGRRQRCKVRVRKYADMRQCFIEVKLKDKRGITVKKRLHYPYEKYGELDAKAMAFIQAAYGDFYGRKFELELRPLLEISYQRVTLVAKNGGERMTIDFGLSFAGIDQSHAIDEDISIVETKSANGNGIADKLLRELHQHPTSRCSKYCMGVAILGVVDRHNNFLPVLRKVNAVPSSKRGSVIDFGHFPSAGEHSSAPIFQNREKNHAA